MGLFIKKVQEGSVIGPLRRKFSVESWMAAYDLYREDKADESLQKVGLLINEKADVIRSELKLTFVNQFRATTKVRAFVAFLNYNFCALVNKTQYAFQQIVAQTENGQLMMHELAGVKLKLPEGAEFSPDEIIQSIVDGVEIPLKKILELNPDLLGNPQFGKLNWDDLMNDSNLGSQYLHIERLWDDCLWNGYEVVGNGREFKFSSTNKAWLSLGAMSRVRSNGLIQQFEAYAQQLQKLPSYGHHLHMLGPIKVTGLMKEGRRQRITLAHFENQSNEGCNLLALRAYASELYYKDLLSEEQASLNGSTLNQLLTAWIVVCQVSRIVREGIDFDGEGVAIEPHALFPNFVPVLQIRALEFAVSEACKVSLIQSAALIDFFVFRGKSDQELWAQPLVPISKGAVTPLFATTTSPNLRRLVDVWLKQLNVDLGQRGPAFEKYICASIRRQIGCSPLLSGQSKCLEHGLKFTPSGDREEQIDVVIVIGNTVILGEAKCFLEPTEAKELAIHRDKIVDAVEQIKRKADSVSRNKVGFRQRLSQLGVVLAEDFTFLPIVILNSAIHCGIAVDGVPIVDEPILEVFFRGELVEMASFNTHEGFKSERKRAIYSSINEAENVLAEYLSAPPQMKPLYAGLYQRSIPIPPINEMDWVGSSLQWGCVPKVEGL